MSPLVRTWLINDRLNIYLLEAVEEGQLDLRLSKGKDIRGQFSHTYSVRLMWLKAARPDLLKGFEKLDVAVTKEGLKQALVGSGQAVAQLVEDAEKADGKVKGFKPDVTAFAGYLISHESYHRAQIEVTLRQAGYPLDNKVAFGLWEWGVR